MVLHVFTANRYQLVPVISEGFVTVYKNDADHVLLLFGDKTLNRQLYVDLYEKENFSDYIFCTSIFNYIKVIWKYRKSSVLFHAGSYHWFLIAWLLGCRKMNWICWGSGASLGKGMNSRLSLPYKRFLYHRFNSIITLMDADKESIIRDFHVAPSKIETISYASKGEGKNQFDCLEEELMLQNKDNPKPVVLLGNNPSCISGYIELLPRMKQYAGKIVVKCMLNYSLVKDENYYELIKLGNSLFGNDFISSEEFYEDRGDYIKYMNECDIYICPVRRQSGLGAINSCLKLGKRVYVTGKNLQWIKTAFNALVFDAEDICDDMSFEVFSKKLSFEEKKRNFDAVVNRRSLPVEKWHQYLRRLDQA